MMNFDPDSDKGDSKETVSFFVDFVGRINYNDSMMCL